MISLVNTVSLVVLVALNNLILKSVLPKQSPCLLSICRQCCEIFPIIKVLTVTSCTVLEMKTEYPINWARKPKLSVC